MSTQIQPGEITQWPQGIKYQELARDNCEYCGRAETQDAQCQGCGAPKKNRRKREFLFNNQGIRICEVIW